MKKNNKKSSLFKIVIFFTILELLLIFSVILFSIFSISIEDPKEVVNSENFSEILRDSISLYGVDFSKAIALYLVDNRTFNNYKIEDFDYTDDEIKDVADEKKLMEIVEVIESYYGGIVAKKDSMTYYNWFFPISYGYKLTYENDWGNPRPNERKHLGNDLMCKDGVPIIAVEDGTITNMGWNNLGGWRIGITSSNGKRYWYYAHMRKIHPYVKSLKKGDKIHGGQVIGYVGSTGYDDGIPNESMPENSSAVDNKFEKHLHLGVYKIENGKNVAYNPYTILNILNNNKIKTEKVENEYVAIEKPIKDRLILRSLIDIAKDGISSLSKKYESNGNPGAIANNPGDIGGKSYGAFQFATNMGSLDSFLMWLKNQDVTMYNKLINAKKRDGGYGTHFDAMWRKIAREQRDYFYNLQYSYIKWVYFDPVVVHFKTKNFDIESRSKTLQAVVWSTSVQHGVGGAINIFSMQNLNGTDKEIITGVYHERMKVHIHFASSSPSIKESVYKRFVYELQDALNMLEAEGGQ